MTKMLLAMRALVATLTFFVCCLQAIIPASADARQDIRQAYIKAFSKVAGIPLTNNIERMFHDIDPAAKGISLDDVNYFEKNQKTKYRATNALQWLVADFDGDLKVSRQELTEFLQRQSRATNLAVLTDEQKGQLAAKLNRQIDEMFQADSDANGLIEGLELYQPTNPRVNPENYLIDYTPFARAMISVDPDGDGRLTQLEATQLATQYLDDIQPDMDKFLADQRAYQREHPVWPLGQTCSKVEVPKEDSLILLGTHEGSSLSTVSVGGLEAVTHATNLVIEEGTRPLSVFVTSASPMIWRFSGATQRVTQLVVTGDTRKGAGGKIDAGVEGIDKGKIQFMPSLGCFGDLDLKNAQSVARVKAIIAKMTGRAADTMISSYAPSVVLLPPGQFEEGADIPNNKDPLFKKFHFKYLAIAKNGTLVEFDPVGDPTGLSGSMESVLEINATGIMDFKPADIVSEVRVEPYDTLPEWAGMGQLAGQGKIERNHAGHGIWKINTAIRIPAGLGGWRSTSFFLPKDVPMPLGNIKENCTYSEAISDYPKESCWPIDWKK